jgi:eukaryotic-like serine/threonine-protein kinase
MFEMTDERWRSFSEHLDAALELTDSECGAWLAEMETRDPDMAALIARALSVRERKDHAAFLQGDLGFATTAMATASMVGRAVGPYVIDAQIGEGGMGAVWRAHRADGRFEGNVAIKFVHAHFVGGAGEQRFRVEGELLARLAHPNIARLLDAGVVEGMQPYLVIEYVEGDPIDVYCNQQQLPLEARIKLFRDVLAAVGHAHSHLVVHRDIKPANILVTRQGIVKLLDFGIGKLLGADSAAAQLTRSSAIALTPQYAAPEQVLGQEITTATDIYALGLVLYVLLTGTHPVRSDTRSSAELLQAVVTEDPPRASLTSAVAAVSRHSLEGDLDNILAKALKKSPAERYQSVDAFSDDLQRFLTHEPVNARPDSLTYRAKKFVRRRRGSVVAAALTLCALLLTAAVALWQAHIADRERDAALLAARRADSTGDFMATLLSDIGRATTPEVQREHLDRARTLLKLERYEDPMVRADILGYLAARYEEFGYTATAIELLQEAKSALGGTERVAVAQIGCELANMYDGLNKEDEADLEVRAAMSVLDSPGNGVRAQVRADCREVESYVATAHLENRRAIAAARKSVSELEAAGLHNGAEHVTALNALARAEGFAGHNASAVNIMRQVRSGESDGGRPQTIGAWIHEFNLTRYLLAGGRVLEAEAAATALAAANSSTGNARDVTLLRARALLALERTADAARLLLAAPLDTEKEADIAPDRVPTRIALLLRLGDTAGAHREWSQQRTAMESVIAAKGESAIEALRVRALLALNDGDQAGADDALNQAVAVAVDADGQPMPGLRRIAALRAEIALKRGAIDEACDSARVVVERARAEAVNMESSASIGEGLLLLAQCEQARGLLEPMRASAQAALPHLEQNLGEQHPLAVRARGLIAAAANSK